jgi:hypothetical protein
METNQPDHARIRAYFSHSYRPEDKYRNLFFWELFSERGCYFTVDQKPDDETPMDITYAEWLMKRSDCFIAVVPKRSEPSSPDGCSPYQAFENGLAIRANKPRLIFVEDGLPEHLFRGSMRSAFSPRKLLEKNRFRLKADILLKAAQKSWEPQSKTIAILSEPKAAYTENVVKLWSNL